MDAQTFYKALREEDYRNLIDVLAIFDTLKLDVIATHYHSLVDDRDSLHNLGHLELLIRGDRLNDFNAARRRLDKHFLGEEITEYPVTFLSSTGDSSRRTK